LYWGHISEDPGMNERQTVGLVSNIKQVEIPDSHFRKGQE
jgi:hypothetical protein